MPSNAVHQYFLKVVPTSFLKLKGEVLSTHQYSVTESSSKAEGFLNGGSRPSGVYFHYELSPIRVSEAMIQTPDNKALQTGNSTHAKWGEGGTTTTTFLRCHFFSVYFLFLSFSFPRRRLWCVRVRCFVSTRAFFFSWHVFFSESFFDSSWCCVQTRLTVSHPSPPSSLSTSYRRIFVICTQQVDYKEHRNTVSEFLTSVCAIVGGVATISGLIQSGVQMIVSYAKSSSK